VLGFRTHENHVWKPVGWTSVFYRPVVFSIFTLDALRSYIAFRFSPFACSIKRRKILSFCTFTVASLWLWTIFAAKSTAIAIRGRQRRTCRHKTSTIISHGLSQSIRLQMTIYLDCKYKYSGTITGDHRGSISTLCPQKRPLFIFQ